MLCQNGRVGIGLASLRLGGEFERAAARRAVGVRQPPAQAVVSPVLLRTQPEDRRGGCDFGVDIADIQGGENAEGCRECRSEVMTSDDRLLRLEAPQGACKWIPADFFTMTDPLRGPGLSS